MKDLIIKNTITGLTEEKQSFIISSFAPVVEKLNKFGKEFPEIEAMENGKDKSDKAKRFRIDFGKQITEADAIRKDLKEESLKESKAIQTVFNYIKEKTEETKAAALDIELYYERIEEEKKKRIQAERENELQKYNTDGSTMDLGGMADEVWKNFVIGIKANHEAEKEAERKAEAERIEAEKKDAEEREEMRLENERLKIENEQAEKKRIADQKKLDKEREKAAAEQKRKDDIIKQERDEKDKLIREAEEKETERLRVEQEEKDRLATENKKAKLAPDKEKLDKLVSYMAEIGKGLKNQEAIEIVREAYKLISGFAKNL